MAKGGKRRGGGKELEPDEILERADAQLRSAPQDWDRVYVRIRFSPLGDDYPRERFLRTPITIIRKVIALIDDQEKYNSNIQSVTTAQLACIVIQTANAFSGSKRRPTKISPKDFLPYPKWKPHTEQSEGPDAATLHILSSLVRTREIPLHAYAALSKPLDGAN